MADDEQNDYWQPGQPWKPRRRADDTPKPWDQVAPPGLDEPVAAEPPPTPPPPPPVEPPASTTAAMPPLQPSTPAVASSRPLGISPNERPDATVMMPVIQPGQSIPPPTQRRVQPAGLTAPPPRQAPVPATPQPARRKRSRTGRFFTRLLILVLVIAVVIGVGAFWVEGQLERVETPSAAGGTGPETYLIVGSDSRENLPDDLEGSFGDFAGQRADVIILAQVSGGTVRMLSLPRDLKVEIPGEGTDKINAAYAYGGPDLMVQTIQSDLGIPIDRYVEVEFGGFASIVDAVGGVELTFEYPTRDLKSGLEVESAGTQFVDGATALAYVRSRSTEEFRDGDWRDADGGDIARTGRQREVLEGIIGRALTPGGFIRLPVLVPAVTGAIRVGDSTHSWNLGLFGFRFATASANESVALPVTGASEGGVSYVVRTEEAGPVIRAFVNGDPLPVEDQ